MILDILITMLLGITPIQGMIENGFQSGQCSPSEFSCNDGACISLRRVCDGVKDCAEGFDEEVCDSSKSSAALQEWLGRGKRQAGCGRTQWQCRDGKCISFDGKCDGVVDCRDGSDETHSLCRKFKCPENLFRCSYGACVDGTAPCNGEQECADNSDEVLPRCFNETRTVGGKFKCSDGQQIPSWSMCDGTPDCGDGSDETLSACAGSKCPDYVFQCAYGACVDQGSDCDGKKDCADNSDESDELCNRVSTSIIDKPAPTSTGSVGSGDCVLPPYPEHGRYIVNNAPAARPGDRFETVTLTIECDPGYGVADNSTFYICLPGLPFAELSKCTRYCELKSHPSVEYTCVRGWGKGKATEPCGERVYPGTTVQPACRTPNYHGSPSYMYCKDGRLSPLARCKPQCGTVTATGTPYVINGKVAKHGELPWHAAIYSRSEKGMKQICGGSLVTTNTIISAAHCFWDDLERMSLPAENYAVGLGKIHRRWQHKDDRNAQYSNVTEIIIPEEFRGSSGHFQYDIAILKLEPEIVLETFIRPICVEFEDTLTRLQLKEGNKGKIAGWGLSSADGNTTTILQVTELPYVGYSKCWNESPKDFVEYLTSDKFCAGFLDGQTALCQGDSGGGLSFPGTDRGVNRYYLRGLVSTAPRNDHDDCDPNVRTTFTDIGKHKDLIIRHVDLEQ